MGRRGSAAYQGGSVKMSAAGIPALIYNWHNFC
jgi:hypothetical protein